MKIKVKWETDGMSIQECGLPEIVNVPDKLFDEDYDAVSDYLSDKYGFLVEGWNYGVKESSYMRVAIRAIKTAVKKAGEFLKTINPEWSIREDKDYGFGEGSNAVAIYEHGSIYDGTILFAIHHANSLESIEDVWDDFDNFNSKMSDIASSTRASVYHEMGHGLYEFLKDMYRDCEEYRKAVKDSFLTLFDEGEDEEYHVETFGEDFEEFELKYNNGQLMKAVNIYKNINLP